MSRSYALAPGIWRHVTYKAMEGWGNVPANGLIVVDGEHAVMIDTPWTPEETAVLLDWLEQNLKPKVEAVVVGHAPVACLVRHPGQAESQVSPSPPAAARPRRSRRLGAGREYLEAD